MEQRNTLFDQTVSGNSASESTGNPKPYLFLILAGVFVLYFPLLFIGKIGDDFTHLLRIDSLTAAIAPATEWQIRPVGNLSILFDRFLFGNNIAGFHLTSILLQLLNIALVYSILRVLVPGSGMVVFATSVYAFHFANVGAVAWISDRWTVLCATFLLSCILFFIKFSQTARPSFLITSFLSFLLALLTKESSLTAIPILMLYLFLYKPPHLRASWLCLAGIAVPAIAYFFLRFFLLTGGGYSIVASKAPLGAAFYLSYLFMPFEYFDLLSLFSVDPNSVRIALEENIGLRWIVATIVGIAAAAGIYFLYRKSRPTREEIFGFFWAMVSVLPFVFWFDPRWLNPATFGVALFFGGFVARYGKRKLLAGILLTLLIVSTVARVQAWVEAGRIVSNILHQVKEKYPKLNSNTMIFFVNVPDLHRNAHVFRHGLIHAIQELYGDDSILVYYNPLAGNRNRPLDEKEIPLYLNWHRERINKARKKGNDVIFLRYDAASRSVRQFEPIARTP